MWHLPDKSPAISPLFCPPALVALAGLTLLACGDSLEPSDPTDLRKGSFRAVVSGPAADTLQGDAIVKWVRNPDQQNRSGWLLRLNYPTGTGPDSVRINFILMRKRTVFTAPDTGAIPIVRWESRENLPVEKLVANYVRLADNPVIYYSTSGSMSVTRSVQDEEIAGRFEFKAVESEVLAAGGDSPSITVGGIYRSGL